MKKPDCYKCQYRGTIPGDAHSCCHYPGNETSVFLQNMHELHIEAVPHGVENGWFFWPFNFDPVWLIRCDGFKLKNKTEKDHGK